ncbi:hypothetical protein ACJX0J_029277 [Zea mays]
MDFDSNYHYSSREDPNKEVEHMLCSTTFLGERKIFLHMFHNKFEHGHTTLLFLQLLHAERSCSMQSRKRSLISPSLEKWTYESKHRKHKDEHMKACALEKEQ